MNYTIFRAIDLVFSILGYAILARVIISWLPISKDNRFIGLLYQITEPILAPIRSIIERSAFGKNMMMDFSPLVAFLLIGIIRNIVAGILL